MSGPFFIIYMPIYLYQNPQTEEIKEIFQSINDIHEYFENGLKWNRVFTVPNASVDTQQDPFSSKQYIDSTQNKKGTYGDLLNKSAELSEQRAKLNGGVDPIKEKFYSDYSKNRRGAKHPDKIPKGFESKNIKVEY